MSKSFKRAAAAGFTLIELLIVVIILAILAAIAIPQFSASAQDAQVAALDSNLATVRAAIEQYRAQHKGFVYPGANGSTGGECAGGTAGSGEPNSPEALREQLQNYSNADGQTCNVPLPGFRFGPYLRQGIPAEPINNSAAIAVTSAGTPIVATTDNGWAYDTKSGQFIMNSTATDPSDKAYSAH